MSQFVPGQRWMSEAEPELGLGVILKVEGKQVSVIFKASEIQRAYGVKSSPLKRVKFEIGEKISSRDDSLHVLIDEVIEEEGILFYIGKEGSLCELDIEDSISFNKPEEKLLSGQIDTRKFFNLRMSTLERKRKWELSPVKGLMGGRISLLAHQLFLAEKICQRSHPRVLLADEVGLGKTIEAGLIIHQMVSTSRAQRVLILVPDSLVYQWFFELHRKFQLGFSVINQETHLEAGENPFLENERMVVSIGLFKGSQVARDLLSQASFDVLVVDEAHRYTLSEDDANFEYELLEELSQKIKSVLLLTATPEQLGLEGHFNRLRLLDAERFSNYEDFKKDVKEYSQVAKIAKDIYEEVPLEQNDNALLEKWVGQVEGGYERFQELTKEKKINLLLDSHGTGRVYFRNTRSKMRKEYDFFPKRILHPVFLTTEKEIESVDETDRVGPSFKEKAGWLIELFSRIDEKVLLICHSKTKVLWLEKYIKENSTNIKTGVFHSDLSLMARDRQAAYFAEPDGANLLLCTEIGSEGRNFEFAHHLILLDLPKKPDLLEQRIGRLDRIGQKADIQIHVPIIRDSWEHSLFDIYNEGLNCFSKHSSVGTPVFIHFQERINKILVGETDLELINDLSKYSHQLDLELEQSRDFLIELNSFDPIKAKSIIQSIQSFESNQDLKQYMEEVFDCFGVDSEELNAYATFIQPTDNMFIPHFPHLDSKGKSVTFERREALEREDYSFLNEDHPMVREVSDLILSEGFGNSTVAIRSSGSGKKSFLEAYFIFENTAPPVLELSRWLPTTMIRVLIDKEGEDFSEKWTKDLLDEKLTDVTPALVERARKIPRSKMQELVRLAQGAAKIKSDAFMKIALEKLSSDGQFEIERLKILGSINKNIDERDFKELEYLYQVRKEYMIKSNVRLDSLRLIF